jgi:hypothetical protein
MDASEIYTVFEFSFAQLGSAISEGRRAHSFESFRDLRAQDHPVSIWLGVVCIPFCGDSIKFMRPLQFWTVTMVTCDVVIAVVMTYYVCPLN